MYLWLSVCVFKQPSPPGPVAIPGGGVPLNMREVEELERMTKDFIKDMDTHAPVITSPPTGTYTHTFKQSGDCTINDETNIGIYLVFIVFVKWFVMLETFY